MPGTVTFKPIEANLTHNTDLIGRMNPYCAFIVGDSIFKGQICKKGGKHPHWEDSVTIPITNQNQVIVEIMDKDRFSRDDNIGSFLINLNELQGSGGATSRWYPLTYKNKPAGEILLETTFTDTLGSQSGFQQQYGQSQYGQSNLQQQSYGQQAGLVGAGYVSGQQASRTSSQGSGVVREEVIVTEQPAIIQQEVVRQTVEEQHVHHHGQIFQEQSQVIEPRTFLKEVDVVETRAHLENIEVLEPQKVMKEVQYTQAVPVTKQIEVVEPQVVLKEVEVIEPRLVTKTIQVIENVPVKKQVEVIESVPRIQEVQTFEPQTFTKTVEVTDYVPVQKQVTVTEPVHLKKAVEFVEPVITTKTITKELMEPVIVDEKITTTIGPASVIAESEIYTTEFARLGITEQDRIYRYNEYNRLRGTGYTDQQLQQHFQTQGWGDVNTYRFHQFGSQWGNNYYSGQNFTNQDRLNRFNEWNRLRGTGYNDQQLQQHFTTQGWGNVSSYNFHQLGSPSNLSYSQHGSYGSGSQFGSTNYSSQDRMSRFKEWLRLKTGGYNDQQLEQHFQTQGWGPVNSYKFYELEQQQTSGLSNLGGSGVHGSHYSTSQLEKKL